MTLSINGKPLDDPAQIYIIGELSGNHGQNYAQAERLVAAAAEAGADAVKTQSFTAEELCADVPILFGYDAKHDAWCHKHGATRLRELMGKGGFPREWHAPLKKFAESYGVDFLSTPFSVDAAKFLYEEIGVPAFKVASGDLTFTPMLEYMGSTELPILLSTGGATLDEVYTAVETIAASSGGDGIVSSQRVIVLHCVSVYPCLPPMLNVRALETLWNNVWVGGLGFSDHSLSYELVPAVVAATGYCSVYEKHVRLEDDDTSVDVGHSLTPSQFKRFVEVLREVPQILGDGIKQPHPLELHDVRWSRRSPKDYLRPTDAARAGAWQ